MIIQGLSKDFSLFFQNVQSSTVPFKKLVFLPFMKENASNQCGIYYLESTATIFTENVNSGSYSPNPLNHIKESYICKENLEKWGKNIWYASQFCLSSLYTVQAIGAILIFSVSYTRKKWNSGSYKYPSTWTINLHDLKLGSLNLCLSIRYLQESL